MGLVASRIPDDCVSEISRYTKTKRQLFIKQHEVDTEIEDAAIRLGL